MVLVGVTIEDGSSDGQFDVTYLALDGSNKSLVVNSLALSGVTGKNKNNPLTLNSSFEDLEGLGRVGKSRVYAISESNFGGGIDDPGVIIRNVDRPTKARLFNLDDSALGAGNSRFGDDSGLALQQVNGDIIGYNVQGSDEVAPIGSRFYTITGGGNPPVVVDELLTYDGKAEFADSLAIQRNNSAFALAADLETADGDGFELYTIELATGTISDVAKINVTDFDGSKLSGTDAFDTSDSGLDIAPGGRALYLLSDATNDVFKFFDPGGEAEEARLISRASRLGALPNAVEFRRVGDFAEENTVAGLGEYEGLAVIDIADPF